MEQTKEDLENIKSKLIEHILKNYDKEKSEELIKNINEMDDKEFIEFLKEQGLVKEGSSEKNQCIFCSIVFGDIPSTKIGENNEAIAILDINPASEGHTLIIPKSHITSKEKITDEVKKLADEVKEKIEGAFNPKTIETVYSNIMGHEAINVLPVYTNESLDSQRKKSTPEELERTKEKIINMKTEIKKEEISQKENKEAPKINEKNTWLPKRFP
ncbi:MAG: HIT domain-containing protein [Nanoarchaeota archaeon]|nr:HIT domain-containing protein [Nanoarchaeota archaeon]